MNATGVPGWGGGRAAGLVRSASLRVPVPGLQPTSSLLSAAQLKDVVRTLEKLNRNGRWKWLLHHRENKKLREDAR